VAPTLIQEMTGHSAGRAISALSRQLVGGKMTNRAAEEWVKLGLVDRKKVIWTKSGHVMGVKPGGLADSALLQSDPYAWIQGYLKPALAKHGITDKAKVAEELAHLFSNQYATQLAQILLTQQQRIEKDWHLIAQAPSSDALEKLRAADPKAALTDLAAGINSLLASLGSPLAGAAVSIMNRMSDAARAVASSYAGLEKTHPWLAGAASAAGAAGLGFVGLKGIQSTFGLLTGSTALKGSAAALTQSAAALDAAAARIGVGGAAGAVPAAVAAGGGLTAGAAGATVAALTAGAAGQAYVMSKYPEYFDTDNPYATDMAHPYRYPSEDRSGGHSMVSDLHAAMQADPPKAELSGSADVNSKVTVEPSPDFIVRVETMISNAIRGLTINGAPPTGTAGSTGSAMPEASPSGAP
jgi:hypothetical protein